MTKKFKVTFDVTAVLPSVTEAELLEDIMELCRMASRGEELEEAQKEAIVQFLTYGMEGVMSFLARSGLREAVKEMHREFADGDYFKFSPATVREVV